MAVQILVYTCDDAPAAMRFMGTWVDAGKGPSLAHFRPMEIDARAAAQADYDNFTGANRNVGAQKAKETRAAKKVEPKDDAPLLAAPPAGEWDDGEAI